MDWFLCKRGHSRVSRSFTNYVDKILAFFDHLPPRVDIFCGINVDKKWTFLDQLPTSSCKRSLWTTQNGMKRYLLNLKFFYVDRNSNMTSKPFCFVVFCCKRRRHHCQSIFDQMIVFQSTKHNICFDPCLTWSLRI